MWKRKLREICSKEKEEEGNYIDGAVDVPEAPEKSKCNFRQFMAFVGPGFLMSIAYLDPGNIESDLRSGSLAGFQLLWVLLLAHILGLLLQRLAARLGVVSGLHLAEVAHEYYPKAPRILLWIMMEITIIGADMQEVIGSAIALNLLSRGYIPLWGGVIITVMDTLTFLLLDRYGLRKLELLFCFLITVMAVTFGTEYVLESPKQTHVAEGTFVPRCGDCSGDILLQAVGIIGAVIMPHNLYLHSGLVKSRRVNRSRQWAISKANMYFFIESAFALGVSFIINLFVVSVFASGLHGKTNADVNDMCNWSNESSHGLFPNDTELVSVDIYSGGIYLGCKFGAVAMYIWAIGILAADNGWVLRWSICYGGWNIVASKSIFTLNLTNGRAPRPFAIGRLWGKSEMNSDYVPAFTCVQGFLQLGWKRWLRVLFSRSIAIVPTLFVAVYHNVESLTGMNDSLNALMMMQLPFALLPMITFTASERVMKQFRLSVVLRAFVFTIAIVAISINLYFLFTFIYDNAPHHWAVFLAEAIFVLAYFLFVLYLVIYCLDALGVNCLASSRLTCVHKLFPVNEQMKIDSPWLAALGNGMKAGHNRIVPVLDHEQKVVTAKF